MCCYVISPVDQDCPSPSPPQVSRNLGVGTAPGNPEVSGPCAGIILLSFLCRFFHHVCIVFISCFHHLSIMFPSIFQSCFIFDHFPTVFLSCCLSCFHRFSIIFRANARDRMQFSRIFMGFQRFKSPGGWTPQIWPGSHQAPEEAREGHLQVRKQ